VNAGTHDPYLGGSTGSGWRRGVAAGVPMWRSSSLIGQGMSAGNRDRQHLECPDEQSGGTSLADPGLA